MPQETTSECVDVTGALSFFVIRIECKLYKNFIKTTTTSLFIQRTVIIGEGSIGEGNIGKDSGFVVIIL